MLLSGLLAGCAQTPQPHELDLTPSPYLAQIETLRAQQGSTAAPPESRQAAGAQPRPNLTEAPRGEQARADSRLLWHFLPKQIVPTARQQQIFTFWKAQQSRSLLLQIGPAGEAQDLESARLAVKRAQHLREWLAGQAITATVRYAPELPANQVLWRTEQGR